MSRDPDAGLVKRGFILLGLMTLLVVTVLFIILQAPRTLGDAQKSRAEDWAWSVVVQSAPFPASISWGAARELSEYLPSPRGWEIRQNAAATLARRGSDHVPWNHFREMLDMQRMTVNCREQSQDPEEVPERTARALVIATLKAVAQWHGKRRELKKTDIPPELPAIYEIVDRLAESPIPELREQAKKTQDTFFRG